MKVQDWAWEMIVRVTVVIACLAAAVGTVIQVYFAWGVDSTNALLFGALTTLFLCVAIWAALCLKETGRKPRHMFNALGLPGR